MDPQKPTFLCVPLDSAWTIGGTKLDLKAMYRRPRRSTDEFDQIVQETGPDGQPLWDVVGPLPLRRHADWMAKGYEYVTLGNMESLNDVAPSLRAKGLNPRDYIQHPQLGPWNPKLYAAGAAQIDRAAIEDVIAAVEKHGVEAYEGITGKKVPAIVKSQLAERAAKATSPETATTEDVAPPTTVPTKPVRAQKKPATKKTRVRPSVPAAAGVTE